MSEKIQNLQLCAFEFFRSGKIKHKYDLRRLKCYKFEFTALCLLFCFLTEPADVVGAFYKTLFSFAFKILEQQIQPIRAK